MSGMMWLAIILGILLVNPSAGSDAGSSIAAGNDPVITFTAGTEMFVHTAMKHRANVCTVNFGQDSSFAGAKTAQGNHRW